MGALRELFDEYECDKGTKKHMYDRCYEPYMEAKRNEPINILEIGCFRGESTKAFLDYFPHANIYTIDIFERVKPKDIEVLNDERCHWLKHDTTNAYLPTAMKNKWGDVKFDFIIDDGAHWPEANRKTFESCFPFLKEDGVYFIEDVWMLDRDYAANHSWVKRRPHLYSLGEHIRLMTTIEKYDLKHYDYTKTVRKHNGVEENYPDSYILRVKNA